MMQLRVDLHDAIMLSVGTQLLVQIGGLQLQLAHIAASFKH